MSQMQLDIAPVMPPGPTEFVFPCAYGGAVKSLAPPQIHAKMRELRAAVGSLAARKSTEKFGPQFPVRGAKELNQKLCQALHDLDMVASVVNQEITHLDAGNVPKNERGSGNPVFRTLVHCKSTVRLIAPDTSFIDVVGSGHGGDVDDKSGGKASTYSWKDAILKGLTVPHEDMVDTDDDSTTSEAGEGGPAVRKAAPRGRKAKEAASGERGNLSSVPMDDGDGPEGGSAVANEPSAAGASGLRYVLDQIKKAETKYDLENIKAQIQSGVLALGDGPERLEASKAYTARMKEMKK